MRVLVIGAAISVMSALAHAEQTSLGNYSDINPSFMTSQSGSMQNSQVNINQGAYSIIGGDQCANTTLTGGLTYNESDSKAYDPIQAHNASNNIGGYMGVQMAFGEVDNVCEKRVRNHLRIQELKMQEDNFAFCGRIYSTLRDANIKFNLAQLKRDKRVKNCLDMVDERASFPHLFSGASQYHNATFDNGKAGLDNQRKKATVAPEDVSKVEQDKSYSLFRIHIKTVHNKDHVKEVVDYLTSIDAFPKGTAPRVIKFAEEGMVRYSVSIQGFRTLNEAYEHAKYLEVENHTHWVAVKGVR